MENGNNGAKAGRLTSMLVGVAFFVATSFSTLLYYFGTRESSRRDDEMKRVVSVALDQGFQMVRAAVSTAMEAGRYMERTDNLEKQVEEMRRKDKP